MQGYVGWWVRNQGPKWTSGAVSTALDVWDCLLHRGPSESETWIAPERRRGILSHSVLLQRLPGAYRKGSNSKQGCTVHPMNN
jgi:hypothetical protein